MSGLILTTHRGVVQSVGHVEPMNQPWLDQLRVFVTDLLVQGKPEDQRKVSWCCCKASGRH